MLKKVLLLVALIACGVSPALAENIKIAVSPGWPPMEFYDNDGKLTGFSIDYATALATELGMEADLLYVPWRELFSGLVNRDYELIVASVSITGERSTMFAFSRGYLNVRQTLLVKANQPRLRLSSLQDRRIGVRQFTTSHYLAKACGAKVHYYDDVTEAVNALIDGRLDGVLCDSAVVAYYEKDMNLCGQLEVSDHGDDYEQYAIVARKDDAELLERVNQAMDNLNRNGVFARLAAKWLGKDFLSQAAVRP